jgi:hypothetical protein
MLYRLDRFTPMPLGRLREPFGHPDWLFELKYNGFRALLSIGTARPEFVSRKANAFVRFSNLALFIDRELDAHAMLDGEVVCFDAEGRWFSIRFSRFGAMPKPQRHSDGDEPAAVRDPQGDVEVPGIALREKTINDPSQRQPDRHSAAVTTLRGSSNGSTRGVRIESKNRHAP